MYKLLIDSDALIKISKAEFLEAVVENFNINITEEIYDETVTEGKKGLHKDADKIDILIQKDKIKIIKKNNYQKNKKSLQSFGKGEISIFQAYKENNIIVTDDLRFTTYIKEQEMDNISSANLLSILVKKKKPEKNKAKYHLEKLKQYIRKEVYELIKDSLEGGEK